jgi:hypothetical protein
LVPAFGGEFAVAAGPSCSFVDNQTQTVNPTLVGSVWFGGTIGVSTSGGEILAPNGTTISFVNSHAPKPNNTLRLYDSLDRI